MKKKRKETIDAKILKATAKILIDMQFDAEVDSWGGGAGADEARQIANDTHFVIMELGIEYASSISSSRPARFEVRGIHRKMHEQVQKVVVACSRKLEDLVLASYPGGPEKARLDEVVGRIESCASHPNDTPLEYLSETIIRGNEMISQLSPQTKDKLAGLVLTLQSREGSPKPKMEPPVCPDCGGPAWWDAVANAWFCQETHPDACRHVGRINGAPPATGDVSP